jgi:hypothetical protein
MDHPPALQSKGGKLTFARIRSPPLRSGVLFITACLAIVLASGCDAAREDYANLSAEEARHNAFATLARLQREGEAPREATIAEIYRDVRPNGEEAWLAIIGPGLGEGHQTCLALWAARPLAELVHYRLFACDEIAPLLKPSQNTTD